MDATTYRGLSSKSKQQLASYEAKLHYEASCFYRYELAVLRPLKTMKFERAMCRLNLKRVTTSMWTALIVAEAMKQGVIYD